MQYLSGKKDVGFQQIYKKDLKKLNTLIDRKHIIKLDKELDKQFISPIEVSVKKDQT